MNSQGLRMAAARLASLHPTDRAWLLRQLPAVQARALQEVLCAPELKRWNGRLGELEIPPPALAAVEADTPVPPTALPAGLRQADPAWIALWLAAHAPKDAEYDIEDLGPSRARKVREAAASLPRSLPPSLRDALAQWPGQASAFAEWL